MKVLKRKKGPTGDKGLLGMTGPTVETGKNLFYEYAFWFRHLNLFNVITKGPTGDKGVLGDIGPTGDTGKCFFL